MLVDYAEWTITFQTPHISRHAHFDLMSVTMGCSIRFTMDVWIGKAFRKASNHTTAAAAPGDRVH